MRLSCIDVSLRYRRDSGGGVRSRDGFSLLLRRETDFCGTSSRHDFSPLLLRLGLVSAPRSSLPPFLLVRLLLLRRFELVLCILSDLPPGLSDFVWRFRSVKLSLDFERSIFLWFPSPVLVVALRSRRRRGGSSPRLADVDWTKSSNSSITLLVRGRPDVSLLFRTIEFRLLICRWCFPVESFLCSDLLQWTPSTKLDFIAGRRKKRSSSPRVFRRLFGSSLLVLFGGLK
mmetsp:Transcript_11374/g.32763  ORF Transcript_11374/g.32763 Transcript_11374/m.32763 type:complete len:230 (-) Transcript_11374:1412-2101(-)